MSIVRGTLKVSASVFTEAASETRTEAPANGFDPCCGRDEAPQSDMSADRRAN
jgi:hypothetical protein